MLPTSIGSESDAYWVAKLSAPETDRKFRVYEGTPGLKRCQAIEKQLPAGLLPAETATEFEVALFLAGLALLACKYDACETILLGVPPLKGDSEPESNPLFFRLRPDDAIPCSQYLQDVISEFREVHSHRAYSLENLLQLLGYTSIGELHRNVGFGFRHAHHMGQFESERELGWILEISQDRDRMCLVLRDPVAAELGGQLADHYLRTVAFLMNHPAARLAELDLLHESERAEILFAGSSGEAPRTAGLSLHALFERQVDVQPSATAVIFQQKRLTYGELNELANGLARYLINDLSVGAGDTVALMVSRSPAMIIGQLAILKAGAAYVPIDPGYPVDVIRRMLEDSGPTALLLESDLLHKATSFTGSLFFMDLQSPSEPVNPCIETGGLAAAYVIYTSGSTGRRKGVVVAHGAIVNTLLWKNDAYGLGSHTVTLQIPSFSFDSSVEDIFCTLSSGGTIVIPTEEERADVKSLRALIQQHGVTEFIITPSYYRAFLRDLETDAMTGEGFTSLRTVTVAGEKVTSDLVRRHYHDLPNAALVNEYGPTENAVCSTYQRLHERDPWVLIGKPIDNVCAFVLDKDMRVVPKGAVGELFLGGLGLARGYLSSPALTAERFVPNPISAHGFDRLYKTGDLARWTAGGSLDFLGRVDGQVKVRGFRVELGEIEAALREHPLVSDAALVCNDEEQGKSTIAYLVGPQTPSQIAEIRKHLEMVLPPYMMPDLFCALEELPMTRHGKLDRSRLTKQSYFDGIARAEPVQVSPLERSLLEIVSEAFGNSGLGLEDDFFLHGGNSLSILTILARARERLNIEVDLSDVYAFPSVKMLAKRIEERLV